MRYFFCSGPALEHIQQQCMVGPARGPRLFELYKGVLLELTLSSIIMEVETGCIQKVPSLKLT